MELITSEIPFSNKDRLLNITLPAKLDEDLAEFVGIVVGDGHLNYEVREDSKFYSVTISCNFTEDMNYFTNTISHLFKKLFNTNLSIIKSKSFNYFNAVKCSKSIVNFLSLNFSIPIGNKTSNIKIPINIINSNNPIKAAFIRGLADTDFSLSFKKRKHFHSYPVIKGSLKSKTIIIQLNKILTEFGFKTSLVLNEKNFDKRFNVNYERHSIYLSGKSNLHKWVLLIGYNNPRLITKYLMWKKFGFCPPNTTLKQRIMFLSEDKIKRAREDLNSRPS